MYQSKSLLISLAAFIILITTLMTCYNEFSSICSPYKNDNLALFLILFSIPTSFSALVAYFVGAESFSSWAKFAKYYLPVAAILIFLAPSTAGIISFDKLIMWWLAGIFFVMSLLIIFDIKK